MSEKQYEIRPAVEADLPVIEKLLSDCNLMAVELAANLKRFLVAEQAGIIGVIGNEYAGDAVLIRSAAVRSSVRQSGVASALLKQALQQAKQDGCQTAYLFTNTAVTFFFQPGLCRRTQNGSAGGAAGQSGGDGLLLRDSGGYAPGVGIN